MSDEKTRPVFRSRFPRRIVSQAAMVIAALTLMVFPGRAQAQTGTISGNVTDAATGGGVTAGVIIFSWNGAGFVSVTSNATTGAYSINVPAGIYFARTNQALATNGMSYVDEAYNDVPCLPCPPITTTTPIYVVAGGTTTVNFPLTAGGAISGKVTDAVTSAPLATVTVALFTSTGLNVKSVFTNLSGDWVVTGLLPGTYFARTAISNTTYLDEAYDNVPCTPCPNITTTTPITVSGTATTPGINFGLLPAGAAGGGGVSGTVTNAVTAAPINLVRIDLANSSGSFVRTTTTDATGAYIITGLAAGTYYARTSVQTNVNVVDEAYNNIPCVPCPSMTTTTPIIVSGTTTTTNINFALSPGGSITGVVTNAATAAPIQNMSIIVWSSSGSFVKSGFSDATGAWSAVGLPTGTFYAQTSSGGSLNFVEEGYNNVPCLPCPSLSSLTPIAVSGTATTPGIDFALTPGGAISGTITDARTGAPGIAISISIINSNGAIVRTGSSNSTGLYTVAGLPAGTYYARTNLSSTVAAELYDNIPCPHLDCRPQSGAPITVVSGGTAPNINFPLLPAGASDVMVDFGSSYGLWMLNAENRWSPIHPLSPVATATGDFDGNGHDDLAVNFGPGYGVYAWMNHATWQFIHPSSPSRMVAGDLDNNRRDDLILSFPGFGVWRWTDTGGFNSIHPFDAAKLAVGDLDGPNGDDLILDFPGYGLWVFVNNSTFGALHPLSAATLAVADLNGNGIDDVVVGFTGYGLWAYRDGSTWSQLHAVTPTITAAGWLDTNSLEELVVDFGPPYGIWSFRNNATWTQLHTLSAQSIMLADRTANLVDEVIVDFGAGVGLWQLANFNLSSGWSALNALNPDESGTVGRFR